MCYKVVAEEKTWQEASQACIFKGGQLAMPKTASINRILTEIIRKYLDRWQDFWFGLWYNNVGKITSKNNLMFKLDSLCNLWL